MAPPPRFCGDRQRLREHSLWRCRGSYLFAGNARGNTKPLAKHLSDRFGGFAEALSANADDLLHVPGRGAGAAALTPMPEALRPIKAKLKERPVIGAWDGLIDYCRAQSLRCPFFKVLDVQKLPTRLGVSQIVLAPGRRGSTGRR